MISVALPAGWVRELLRPWPDRLAVAAVNGPESVVVSGEPEALDEFERTLSAQRILRLRVPGVQFGAHSAQIDALAEPLLAALAPIRPRACVTGLFSTVRCDWIAGSDLDAEYWYRNIRDTVRFEDATRRLIAHGVRVFVEVSAHPVLVPALRETVEAIGVDSVVAVGLSRRDDGGMDRFLASLAEIHVHGVAVDWPAVLGIS